MCALAVLVIKLVTRGDADLRWFRIQAVLLATGSVLYIGPYILGIQVTAIDNDTARSLASILVSSQNPGLAMPLCYLSAVIAGLLGLVAVVYNLRQAVRRPRRGRRRRVPMSGDDLAQALTSGGETWMVLSLSAVLPILWAFALTVHFARPYVVRFLGTLTLRFGADVWWLSYVLIRDGLMLLTLALSAIFLMPNLYIGLGLPLTAPLSTVVLFWALVIKLTRDADDDPAVFRWVSVLLVIASVLYIVPQIYGLESADQVDALTGVGLDWTPGALSAANPDEGTINGLAWPIIILSLVLFSATGAYLFGRFLTRLGRPASAAAEAPTAD